MSKLSERLQPTRKARGYTQQQMVNRLGAFVSSTAVYSSYERGTRSPDYDTLVQIAKILGVTTDFLLGNSDEEAPQAKEFAEATGLDPLAASRFILTPYTSTFVNAVFSSDLFSEICAEAYFIQNMIERINYYEQTNASDDFELYRPDNKESVRISSEDFFAYHSYKLGCAVAAAVKQWAISAFGGRIEKDTPTPDGLPF